MQCESVLRSVLQSGAGAGFNSRRPALWIRWPTPTLPNFGITPRKHTGSVFGLAGDSPVSYTALAAGAVRDHDQ